MRLLHFHIALVIVNSFENHIFQLLGFPALLSGDVLFARVDTTSEGIAVSHFGITNAILFSHSMCNLRLVCISEFLIQLSNKLFQCVYAAHNVVWCHLLVCGGDVWLCYRQVLELLCIC